MILQVLPDGKYKNMHVTHYPAMTLFHPSLTETHVEVRYRMANPRLIEPNSSTNSTLKIPLIPDFEKLDTLEVVMHESKTTAYKMLEEYNHWFSECFGYKVVLAYLGDGLRPVLGNLPPTSQPNGWFSSIASYLPGRRDSGISFSDCAPFLVVSEASLEDVHIRLQGDEKMDITKFRPNIVLDGEEKWDEDFWGGLRIKDTEIILTANCIRCTSVNIDYETGKPGTGDSGTVLKKLMKDRRVDAGAKYSPVFGRYGFLGAGSGTIAVEDEVVVSKRNGERTKFGMCLITPFPFLVDWSCAILLTASYSPHARVILSFSFSHGI